MDSNNPQLKPRLVHLFKKSRSERYGFTNAYNYKVGNYIKALVPGFPAEKMGVKIEDIIFEVNGHNVFDLNVQGVSKLIKTFPTRTSLLVLDPIAVDYCKINGIPINGQMEGIVESVDWPEWVKVAENKVTIAETETQQNVEEEPQTGTIVTGSIFETGGEIRHIENEICIEKAPETASIVDQSEHFIEAHASMSRMEKALLGIQELLVEIRDKLSASRETTSNMEAEQNNLNNATQIKLLMPQVVNRADSEEEQKFFRDWVDVTPQ